MVYEIEFSKRSLSELKKTFDFLLINWSFKTAVEFLEKFFLKINNISQHPYAYSKSALGRNIRRCVVTKHITLYYKIKKYKIFVLFLFDNRQSPDKLKL